MGSLCPSKRWHLSISVTPFITVNSVQPVSLGYPNLVCPWVPVNLPVGAVRGWVPVPPSSRLLLDVHQTVTYRRGTAGVGDHITHITISAIRPHPVQNGKYHSISWAVLDGLAIMCPMCRNPSVWSRCPTVYVRPASVVQGQLQWCLWPECAELARMYRTYRSTNGSGHVQLCTSGQLSLGLRPAYAR